MKAKLPILPLLCWLSLGFPVLHVVLGAQPGPNAADTAIPYPVKPPEEADPEDTTHWREDTYDHSAARLQPQSLLAEAIRRLEEHASIAASIRHEVDLFGQRLSGSGSYFEEHVAGKRLIRLELKIQLGGRTSSFLQVCDGDFLWTYQKLFKEPTLTRIDVARALEGLRRARNIQSEKPPETLPGLGGLPKILRGLHASFEFTAAERGQWGREKRVVWRLRGHWRDDRLPALIPEQKEAIEKGEPPDLSKLPQHLPDHVVLLLGQNDLFPYRIEYRRGDGPDGRTLVAMQLYDVRINGPTDDPDRFIYKPDLKPTDRTQQFLDSL